MTTTLLQTRPPIQRLSRRQPNPGRAEIEELLKSYLQKTGFPLAEIERLKAAERAQRRQFPQSQADAAGVTDEQEAEFRRVICTQREAMGARAAPGSLITLDQPTAIELFNDEFFLDFNTHIESFNSFAQLRLETHTGFGHPVVAFTYEWINPSSENATISIGGLLRLTGFVDVKADASFFDGGHFNQVGFSAQLIATRGTGWGTDPSGNSLDGTRMALFGNTFQGIAGVSAQGGLFLDDDENATYAALPVGLGVDNILIPGGASILFGILFEIDFFMDSNADGDDLVSVDFRTDQFNRRIASPFFHIEVA